jgi:hypothetical protein
VSRVAQDHRVVEIVLLFGHPLLCGDVIFCLWTKKRSSNDRGKMVGSWAQGIITSYHFSWPREASSPLFFFRVKTKQNEIWRGFHQKCFFVCFYFTTEKKEKGKST